jgi:hypothetical protein
MNHESPLLRVRDISVTDHWDDKVHRSIAIGDVGAGCACEEVLKSSGSEEVIVRPTCIEIPAESS